MRNALVLSLTILLASCGGSGGGGGTGPDTLPGTYSLSAFTILFDDGSSANQDDANTYSGTLVLNTDGSLSQTVEVDGSVAGDTGTWTQTSGSTMQVYSVQANCTGFLSFTLNNGVLFLTSDHQCGNNFTRTMVWSWIGPPQAKPAP